MAVKVSIITILILFFFCGCKDFLCSFNKYFCSEDTLKKELEDLEAKLTDLTSEFDIAKIKIENNVVHLKLCYEDDCEKEIDVTNHISKGSKKVVFEVLVFEKDVSFAEIFPYKIYGTRDKPFESPNLIGIIGSEQVKKWVGKNKKTNFLEYKKTLTSIAMMFDEDSGKALQENKELSKFFVKGISTHSVSLEKKDGLSIYVIKKMSSGTITKYFSNDIDRW
jgi:hypothetical protein